MSNDDAGFDKDGSLDFDRFVEFILKQFKSLQEQIKPLEKLASIEQGVINLGTRMEAVGGEIESIKENLAALNAKVDERLQDTRPLWEGVALQLTELREGQDKFSEELRVTRASFGRIYADLLTAQEMHERHLSDLERQAS
jgi:hypothetical protein